LASRFKTYSRPLQAVIVGIPASGLALATVTAASGGFSTPFAWRWAIIPGCVASVLMAERFPVKIGVQQKVNLAALPCMVAALLLPPGVGPATVFVSVFAANLLVAHRTIPESVVNAGNTLVSASITAMVGAIGANIDLVQELRTTIAGLLYVSVNLALAVLPAALNTKGPYLSMLKRAIRTTWTASLTLAACAVSIAVLSIEAPIAAPLPLMLLPMIYHMNRSIEAQAKANEQLTSVLSAQRRFLTDVSHQVATPLATIMTNLTFLNRAGKRDRRTQAVADSVTAAERMNRMFSRLRALAHADEDVPLRRELLDLAELTSDVVRAYSAQAETSGVELVTEVNANTLLNVDKDLLREAVANLVDNAVRASPPGAEVKLRIERGTSGASISVVDSGPGIEEERLASLFERFQRSQSGSGLGLAIAQRVVERHGGTIRVQTKRGSGSTFTIELPD